MPLSNIIHGKVTKPPKLAIYGDGGVGKSTWAACAPSPLFVCCEEGANHLDVAKTPLCQSYVVDVYNLVAELINEQHEFKTLVIDALDSLEMLIWAAVCQEQSSASSKEFKSIEDFGYGKGYGFALDYWKMFLGMLDRLRDEKGMAIILIAHSQKERHEDPRGEGYDRYNLRLHKKAAAAVHDWADIVAFASHETIVRSTGQGFNERQVGVSTGNRILHLEANAAYVAKRRGDMPATIPLDWAAFMDAYKAAN